MKNNSIINILNVSSYTAIGSNSLFNASAVRAGINCFKEHLYMIDKSGEPMIVSSIKDIPLDINHADRFYFLAEAALYELLLPFQNSGFFINKKLYLGLPIQRLGLGNSFSETFNSNSANLKSKFNLSNIYLFPYGHAATFSATMQAIDSIKKNQADVCVIGGIDSYLIPETLEYLDETAQLHSTENRYGFTPGEGAGFCLLASEEATERLGIEPLGQIVSVGVAMEENLINTDSVCIGEGLTEAYRQALSVLPEGIKIDQIYTDMNGERYRADEYGFTILRTQKDFKTPESFIAPADCWGDVGAASGALLINLAVTAAQKGYAKGDWSLISTSSNTGERAAAVIYVPNHADKGDITNLSSM